MATQEEADQCHEWAARINTDKARLDNWQARLEHDSKELNQKIDAHNLRADRTNAEFKSSLVAFITDAKAKTRGLIILSILSASDMRDHLMAEFR
jgi:hypothetical protein